MNKSPLTKKQIVNLFKKQKIVIFNSEKVNLENSDDRFLYENIKSKINLPPFNNSAVDGYAILKTDLKTKKVFFCNRRIAAGDNKNIKVKPGEAVRIFTGAKMPSNSSTVVMQENTYKKGNKIHLIKIPKFGDNHRLKGEDIKKNQKILEKGSKLNQQNINLIAATGISKIKVFKKIKIGFFTSGNELRKPTKNLKNSEINNSNYYSLNNSINIALNVNIEKWLSGIDLINVGIDHSSSSNNLNMCNNTTDNQVFQAINPTSINYSNKVIDITTDYNISYAPTINYKLDRNHDFNLKILNSVGQLMLEAENIGFEGNYFIRKELKSGNYFAVFYNSHYKYNHKFTVTR